MTVRNDEVRFTIYELLTVKDDLTWPKYDRDH